MKLRHLKTLLAAVFVLLALHTTAWPILLETPTGTRVEGFLVSEDDQKLTVRIPQAAGKDKVKVYDRATVKIIHQVDRPRLARLSKDDPRAYRDYAEELAQNRDDPEARETARRLFLIAAYLDPALARACLLRMSTLATTPAEARRCRGLAFLLDPGHDPGVLKADAGPAPARVNDNACKNFVLALRAFRNGQTEKAAQHARVEGVAQLFAAVPGLMDHGAFLAACKDGKCKRCMGRARVRCAVCDGKGGVADPASHQVVLCEDCNGGGAMACPDCRGTGWPLTDTQLRALVRAELWATELALGADPAARKAGAELPWASLRGAPLRPLTLETLTDIDPRRCVFRNGRWVEP